MSSPTMWCMKTPKGRLVLDTMDKTKGGAHFRLFDLMPAPFRERYWKDLLGTAIAYKRLGYKVTKVGIIEKSNRER
jgi:hypothetical protein